RQLWNQGIAPILVVIDSEEVSVYSSLTLPAKSDENINTEGRLIELLHRTADVLKIRQLIRRVETGELFKNHPSSFNPQLRVDRHLLKNLSAVRRKLRNAYSKKLYYRTIHALLGRVIFTCYLV